MKSERPTDVRNPNASTLSHPLVKSAQKHAATPNNRKKKKLPNISIAMRSHRQRLSTRNKHSVVVKSITRKPLLFLQTLSSQHVCSRRGFSRLKLCELSGLGLNQTRRLHARICASR